MQGHIHKRVHRCRDGRETVNWYVVVDVGRDVDGRRRQKWHGGFRTRREAEVVRARVVNDLHHNRYVMPDRLTLAEWVLHRWLPMIETQIKPATYVGYKYMMERHLLPRLGHRPIQALAPRDLEGLYVALVTGNARRKALSVKTVRNVRQTIHKALADAVDAGILADNFADRAKVPRRSETAIRRSSTWQPSELAAFLKFVRNDRLAAIWRLVAMTGMRRGELLGLRWMDVDLERAELSIVRTIVAVNYRVLESIPKGGSARTIALDRDTVALLAAHRERQHAEQQLWGDDYERGDRVVAWENGSSIHPDSFSQLFRALVRRAGLRPIRLHDVRHTHATLALHSGIPVAVVSERLGHHSAAFTLSQYGHALPGMQAVAAATVAELVRSAGFAQMTTEPRELEPLGASLEFGL